MDKSCDSGNVNFQTNSGYGVGKSQKAQIHGSPEEISNRATEAFIEEKHPPGALCADQAQINRT